MDGVWMVEWQGEYNDSNAAFSTREKAIQYIRYEAHYRKLENFHEVEKDFSTWGGFEFTDWNGGKARVFYSYYPLDTYKGR